MNVWSPVALAEDAPPGAALAVRLGGAALALWRSASGGLAAWSDRCPAEGARLSAGAVEGERLVCPACGRRFDGEGRCVAIPARPDLDPPPPERAETWACAEASGLVWVAPAGAAGAPSAAARGMVPTRSLTAAAAPGAVLARLEGWRRAAPGLMLGEAEGMALALGFRPAGAGETTLHLLVADPRDRARASLWAEALRDAVEEAAPRDAPDPVGTEAEAARLGAALMGAALPPEDAPEPPSAFRRAPVLRDGATALWTAEAALVHLARTRAPDWLGGPETLDWVAAARRPARGLFRLLDLRLALEGFEGRSWLAGGRPTIAEPAAFPAVAAGLAADGLPDHPKLALWAARTAALLRRASPAADGP